MKTSDVLEQRKLRQEAKERSMSRQYSKLGKRDGNILSGKGANEKFKAKFRMVTFLIFSMRDDYDTVRAFKERIRKAKEMRFDGRLTFRCKRCGYWLNIADILGYYPNLGDEITVKCPYCGEEQ